MNKLLRGCNPSAKMRCRGLKSSLLRADLLSFYKCSTIDATHQLILNYICFICQKVGIKDKFFYDALLLRIEEIMPIITSSSDLALLSIALNSNPDFKRDNMGLMLKFYEHAHGNRFLLKQEDKQVLSRIFSEMGLGKYRIEPHYRPLSLISKDNCLDLNLAIDLAEAKITILRPQVVSIQWALQRPSRSISTCSKT